MISRAQNSRVSVVSEQLQPEASDRRDRRITGKCSERDCVAGYGNSTRGVQSVSHRPNYRLHNTWRSLCIDDVDLLDAR